MTEVYNPKKSLNLDKPPSLDRAELKRIFKRELFSDSSNPFDSFGISVGLDNIPDEVKVDILRELVEENRIEYEKKNKKIEK